jgi:hypothetical protein
MPPEDDDPIAAGAGLLRRIHPRQVIKDSNTGTSRPSSAAFKDLNLSVDLEPALEAAGLDWHFSLRDHPGYSLVRFPVKAALDQCLTVERRPIAGNVAHAEVLGKKTQGKANSLRDASSWVHLVEHEEG